MSEEVRMRPVAYRRKRDGLRVIAGDWPDGSVSWMLDPAPVVCSRVAGTCSARTFNRTHDELLREEVQP